MQKKSSLKIFIWIAVFVALGIGGFSAVQAYRSPLAPALDLPAPASKVSAAAVAVQTAAPKTSAQQTCGTSGALNVLFIGSDSSFGHPPYGADSVRLVKVDFDAHKVATVAFSRDLVVPLSGSPDAEQALGLAFYDAYQAAAGTETEKVTAATNVVARIMVDDFGVTPDYYLTLELDAVAPMVDTIGGIEIAVPGAVTTENGVYFPAGKQTLTGQLAAEYARYNFPGGDSARIQRQEQFFKALLGKVTKTNLLAQAPALLTQFKDAVVTDLSPEQLVSFTCLAEKVGGGNFKFYALDKPGLVDGSVPNLDAVKDYLAKILSE